MADKKTKKKPAKKIPAKTRAKLAKKKVAKKKATPRTLKKVARRIRDRARARASFIDEQMKHEERDLWRFVVISSCVHGDAKLAIKSADQATRAFRTRYRLKKD
jgi:hypothetical protein